MSDPLKIQQGSATALNITAATLIKGASSNALAVGPVGRLVRINVTVAGSAVGSANDAATVATAATANQVFVIPNTVGSYLVDVPCFSGIVVTPGTGQTVAVIYD